MANNQVRGITIEIGGDTSKLGKALQNAETQSRNLQKELKQINAALKMDPSNVELAAQKQKVLKEQIEATKEKLDILKKAEEQVAKQFKAGEIGEEQFRAFQRELTKTESELKSYQSELEKTNKKSTALEKLTKTIDDQEDELAKLKNQYKEVVIEQGKNSTEAKRLAGEIKALSGDLKDNKDKMAEADKAADDLDKSLEDVGDATDTASGGFTVMKGALADLVADGIRLAVRALKDLVKETYNVGSSFESEMSKVAAISGATGDDIDALKEKALEMGSQTVFTASEAAQALEYMAMAGWKTDDMLDGLEGIMNLAAASGEDLATTSDIVTDALTALGMSADEAGHFADVLAAASSNANTNVSMMGESFKYVAPVAGALGFSAEDLSVALGLMANSGIKASQAGTTLRTILTNMSAPTEDVQAAMDALGISLTDDEGNMKSLNQIMEDLRGSFGEIQMPLDEFNAKMDALNKDLEDGCITEEEYNQKVDELTTAAYGAGDAMLAQVEAAKTLAGQRGISGLLAIVNAADEDFNTLTTAINNCDGAAAGMANTMNDNVAGKLTLLKSKIESIMIKVFDQASDSMKTGIDKISEALDKVDWDKFAEGVGDFAEAVADLVVYLIDHAEEVLNVLKGIATAFVTYKAVSAVNSVYKEFSTLFTLISGTGITSIGGLGTAMAALPLAAVAAGIGTVILADQKYAEGVRTMIQENYLLSESDLEVIGRNKELYEAYKNLRNDNKKNLERIDDEYDHLQDLVTEYDSLLDDMGRVKRGNEERAIQIKGELAQALGIEQSEIDKIVKEQGKLADAIDEVIIKRQAEATLNANETVYREAKELSAQATIDYADQVEVARKAEENYKKALEDQNAVWASYSEATHDGTMGLGEWSEANSIAAEAVEETKKQWEAATAAVDEQGESLAEINSTIRNYEGLASAIIEGDAKKIKQATEDVTTGFVTAKDGSKEALQQQVIDTDAEYTKIKRAYELGAAGITESMVTEYANRSARAHSELELYSAQEYSDMYSAGEQANQGFKDGSAATSNYATEAAESFASKYIKKFKESLGIQSPSKVTKEIGVQTGEGFIIGLNSTIKSAQKAAANMTGSVIDTFSAGQDYAASVIRSADSAHQKALNKLESDYTKASAKIQKKIDKLTAKGDELTKAEKKELKDLQKQLKAEEKEYTKAVKELNAQISQEYVDAAEARITKLKKTNSITVSEEVTFWREILDSTKKGTAAWETANDKLAEAKKALANEISSITQDFIKDAADTLDQYNDVIASRAEKLENSFGLFDSAKIDEAIGGKTLIKNLKSQVNALKEYEEATNNLRDRLGEDSPLYKALKDQGVGALGTLQAIGEMSDKELKEYADLYAKRASLSEKIAKEENQDLKEAVEAQVWDLWGAYEDALVDLDAELTAESRDLGKAITDGIAQGLEAGTGNMTDAMKKTIEKMITETKKDLGIHSPSKVMADEVGRWMPPGIAEGFEDAAPAASASIQRSLAEMTDDLSAGINGATFGRQLNSSFATVSPTADFATLLSKVDLLLAAVKESGSREIVLDSGALVGGTIDRIDAGLGTIYAQRERGM